MNDKRDWSDDELDRLRALWAEGLSLTAIGAELGRSKNSVCGKVHRLDLPPRPSPIRPKGSGAPQQRRVALPGVAKVRGEHAVGGGTLVALGLMAPVAPAPAAPVIAPRPGVASKPCCWPLGEPRTNQFRFCEAAGVPGRPYCAEHCALAYAPQVVRSEAQVAADDARRAAAHARMAAAGGFSVGGFRSDWSV